MPWIEKEGRTVEEARAAAIAAAGRPEEDLEVEVLREGAKGLFGLGGEPALVRVRPRSEARDVRGAFRDDLAPTTGPADPAASAAAASQAAPAAHDAPPVEDAPVTASAEAPPAREGAAPPPASAEEDVDESGLSLTERQDTAMEVGEEMVRGILQRMGLEGEVTTRASGGTVYIEIFGDNMGILIGRGGATLEALQELVRAGVQRRLKTRQAVIVDVEAYWERRRGRGGRGGGQGSRGGRRGRNSRDGGNGGSRDGGNGGGRDGGNGGGPDDD